MTQLNKYRHKPKQVGAFDAKTHFSELLAQAATGQEFIITRHGQKIAMLVPFVEKESDNTITSAICAIKKLRAGVSLGKRVHV